MGVTMETTTLTNTLPGVPAWSDVAMRTAIERHMADRLWTVKDLAYAMSTSIGSTERWLAGDASVTMFRARLKRYLESLGYPGDEAAVANARRLAAANGHHREPDPGEPESNTEPEPGHARIDAAIETINAEVAAEPARYPHLSLGAPVYEGTLSEPVVLARCRVCGCTDEDCSGCLERTGAPCHWVEPDLCSACAAAAGVTQITVSETAEPEVAGEYVGPATTVGPSAWSLPAGFTVLAPAPRLSTHPAGISISPKYSRATLSTHLYRDELEGPTHVLIAVSGSVLLIVRATAETEGAMRVGKDGDLSSSVARYVQTIGKPAGFYPAVKQDDGSWLISTGKEATA
jgi:hypothetical protein